MNKVRKNGKNEEKKRIDGGWRMGGRVVGRLFFDLGGLRAAASRRQPAQREDKPGPLLVFSFSLFSI